jgi:hypothetical protein
MHRMGRRCIFGAAAKLRTLIAAELVDEYRIWVFPLCPANWRVLWLCPAGGGPIAAHIVKPKKDGSQQYYRHFPEIHWL